MIEYPSIMPSDKAPHPPRIAFDKLDGSNIHVKYTNKLGLTLFESKTQMFDKNHPFLGAAADIFYHNFEDRLVDPTEDNFPSEHEVIAFLEFFGSNSFTGVV